MNANITNWKLGIRHTPQSFDPKSVLDLWLASCNKMKYLHQIRQDISAVTNIYMGTKPKSIFVPDTII